MNCGTMEHTDDCLCDVIVTEPTPINYGLSDHWVLSMVAKHFDMSIPFSNADLTFLLEKSHQFLEVYLPIKDRINLPSFPHRDGMEIPAKYWKRMRAHIVDVVEQCEGRILPSEVCEQMDLTHEEFVNGLSSHHPNPNMTVELMDTLVTRMRQGSSYRSLYKQYGLANKLTGTPRFLRDTFVVPYIGQPSTVGD